MCWIPFAPVLTSGQKASTFGEPRCPDQGAMSAGLSPANSARHHPRNWRKRPSRPSCRLPPSAQLQRSWEIELLDQQQQCFEASKLYSHHGMPRERLRSFAMYTQHVTRLPEYTHGFLFHKDRAAMQCPHVFWPRLEPAGTAKDLKLLKACSLTVGKSWQAPRRKMRTLFHHGKSKLKLLACLDKACERRCRMLKRQSASMCESRTPQTLP